jgi:5-methylcytosine-specific restriction enzyme B
MSRYCGDRDPEQKVSAAIAWRDKCLLGDGSMLSDTSLWTKQSLDQLDQYFSRNLDEGEGDFFEKLEAQLRPSAAATKKLAAEMLWVMFLAPSNITPDKKREGIANVWSWSGEDLQMDQPMLADSVLDGVGSGGMGFNNYRWKELVLLIDLVRRFKRLDAGQQKEVVSDAWRFAEWIDTVPGSDSRQLPFMLKFLLYPDQFERMFAGGDRRSVLVSFRGLSKAKVAEMSSVEIDRQLKAIREEQEAEHETKELDFYISPLMDTWKGHGTQSYLLTWNPDNWPWESFSSDRNTTRAGKSVVARWTCSNGHAKVGDRAYLLRTGVEPRGIIARGNIVRAPYRAEHWDAEKAKGGSTRNFIDVEFTTILDPKIDEFVPASALTKITVSDQDWSPQASGIFIKPRPAAHLEKLWQKHVKTISKPASEVREPEAVGDARVPTNLIWYGPPGTGKTYRVKQLFGEYSSAAEDQTENDWLQSLIQDMTWWEVIAMALHDLGDRSTVQDIIEHRIVQAKARIQTSKNVRATLWGSLQLHARADSKTVGYANRSAPLVFDKSEDSRWFLLAGWEVECPQIIEAFGRLKAGRGAGGVSVKRYMFVTFHQSYGYEDFVEGIRPLESEEGAGIVYRVVPGVFRRICLQAKIDPAHRYAIFIDEINRGNIAKILGELITLIEPDKRAIYDTEGRLIGGMEATLPYSGDLFGVPINLDIIATMNTADRSIALLDTALRRRFRFEELMPESGVISGADGRGLVPDDAGDTIDLRALLDAMNRRLRFLLHRDQTLGHAYFMDVKTFEDLRLVMLGQVVPLLQEYFYEDWRRIQLVLRDIDQSGQPMEPQIVRHRLMRKDEALGIDHDDFEDCIEYWLASAENITADAIRKIYETA